MLKKTLLVSLTSLAFSQALLSTPLSAELSADTFPLVILHDNDFHARFQPVTIEGNPCTQEAQEQEPETCFGGAARLAQFYIDKRAEHEERGQNVLTLNAGDNFQGTPYFTYFKGQATAELVNFINYDALVLGNHEFDNGKESLFENFLQLAQIPVLSANPDYSMTPEFRGPLVPYIIKEIQGRKIGIIGLTTPDTANIAAPQDNNIFAQHDEVLPPILKDLRDQGVNIIIALTHTGFKDDLVIAKTFPEIDIIVGGHSHTLLSNNAENAEGPYPTLIEHDTGTKTAIVHAGSLSRYVGELTTSFNSEGDLITAEGNPILLDSSLPQNESYLALLQPKANEINAFHNDIVTTNQTALTNEGCRQAACDMGALITQAMQTYEHTPKIDIALLNSGGIRAGFTEGDVTVGDILTVLPFENRVSVFGLTGQTLLEVLEHGSFPSGGFLQVAGATFDVDSSQEKGSRISNVYIQGDNGAEPLDLNQVYTVAAQSFLRSGGDGFTMLKTDALNPDDFGPIDAELLVDYLQQFRTLQDAL